MTTDTTNFKGNSGSSASSKRPPLVAGVQLVRHGVASPITGSSVTYAIGGAAESGITDHNSEHWFWRWSGTEWNQGQ